MRRPCWEEAGPFPNDSLGHRVWEVWAVHAGSHWRGDGCGDLLLITKWRLLEGFTGVTLKELAFLPSGCRALRGDTTICLLTTDDCCNQAHDAKPTGPFGDWPPFASLRRLHP